MRILFSTPAYMAFQGYLVSLLSRSRGSWTCVGVTCFDSINNEGRYLDRISVDAILCLKALG